MEKVRMECPGAKICNVTGCYHYHEHDEQAGHGCEGICFGTKGCEPVKQEAMQK